jgi:hypothetical protein
MGMLGTAYLCGGKTGIIGPIEPRHGTHALTLAGLVEPVDATNVRAVRVLWIAEKHKLA